MKVLTARFLLPIASAPIENGAILLGDNGTLSDVGPRDKILKKYPDAVIEEFANSVLMPGLVNAHSHLDLFRYGTRRSEKDLEESIPPNFFDWLMGSWEFRKKLTPSDRRQSIEDGCRQLVRVGTTTAGDAGYYAGVLQVLAHSPLRLVLFPELVSGGEPGGTEGYEAALTQVDELIAASAQNPKISVGLAPYAAYTLSRHILKIISEQARRLGIPIKIHVAESFQEMQFFFESSGEIAEKLFPKIGWADQIPPEHHKTPIQYLQSIGFLDNHPTLVGCNHLSGSDIEIIARSGSKVVHSPRANTRLKLGHPPLKKLRAAGIPVALGTDGNAALFSLSLWDEMRFIQENYPKSVQPTSKDLLQMATLEGAKALGLEKKIGSLEIGKQADLLAVSVPKNTKLTQLADGLINRTTERDITAVFVNGKCIKL